MARIPFHPVCGMQHARSRWTCLSTLSRWASRSSYSLIISWPFKDGTNIIRDPRTVPKIIWTLERGCNGQRHMSGFYFQTVYLTLTCLVSICGNSEQCNPYLKYLYFFFIFNDILYIYITLFCISLNCSTKKFMFFVKKWQAEIIMECKKDRPTKHSLP